MESNTYKNKYFMERQSVLSRMEPTKEDNILYSDRNKMKSIGFKVVFGVGMSDSEAISFLVKESSSLTKILAEN